MSASPVLHQADVVIISSRHVLVPGAKNDPRGIPRSTREEDFGGDGQSLILGNVAPLHTGFFKAMFFHEQVESLPGHADWTRALV